MSSKIIPFKPRQIPRLYGPIILFKALTDISQQERAVENQDTAIKPRTEEERYQRFVDRLASVCDRDKGGRFVTSVTILEKENQFLYVFVCNKISHSELNDARHFLITLLRMIAGISEMKKTEQWGARNDVLDKILLFNRRRVDVYIKDLKRQIPNCIESCRLQNNGVAAPVLKALQGLEVATMDINLRQCGDVEFLNDVKRCFASFDKFLARKNTSNFIDRLATKGRHRDGRSVECWSELRHALNRLQAYSKTVNVLTDAEREWPELFLEFQVVELQSSKPDPNPFGKRLETADKILTRMSSSATRKGIDQYKELAETLQSMGLDERIQEQCGTTGKGIKPYVHSEILVLEWVIEKYHPIHLKFFKDFRYIGSSKGACKLCRYYFEAPGQHNDIKTRSSHGNIYSSWRFPDLSESDGQKRRQNIYNYITDRTRADAFQILENKTSSGKRHDSSSHPLWSDRHTDVRTDAETRELPDVEELREQVQAVLMLSDSMAETGSRRGDWDDEDGGARL